MSNAGSEMASGRHAGVGVPTRGYAMAGAPARRIATAPVPVHTSRRRPGPSAQAGGRATVLVLRSCRAAQFEAAVAFARTRHPGAEVVALSHRGHEAGLRAAGVDRVIEVPGHRFGPLRLGPWAWRRLRTERFTTVVVPQMTPSVAAHTNLYWTAALLQADHVIVLPGDRAPQEFDQDAFRAFTRISSVQGLATLVDAPLLLVLLAWAGLRRLRRPPAARDGARRRVLLVISSLGAGGAQVQLAELLNRMPRDEYEVDLLALGNDGGFSRQWLTRDDVDVSVVEHWPHLSASVLEIAARCRARQYDIVHTWLFMANVVAVAGARLAGVPVVIASVRNLSVWKRERWYRKWWHRAADILGSWAADLVTVNARALVADHGRWAWTPRARMAVVHNGLDPSHFLADRRESRTRLLEATGAPAGAVFVGTVGRLAPEKDHATFLRVLAVVCRERPEVHGVIVGGGDLRPALAGLAEELGLAGRVTLLGERRDARVLMAGFDLFVLTSRSEGFPNVLLEATLLGVPGVATDIAGSPDILVADEALFPVGDVQAGAQRVRLALDHRRRATARAVAARERALQHFTAEHSVETWLHLYRRMLAQGRA